MQKIVSMVCVCYFPYKRKFLVAMFGYVKTYDL